MPEALRLGIAGLGTVGTGVVKALAANAALYEKRSGRPVAIAAVSARDAAKDRGVDLSAYRWEKDALALANAPDVDVVVELIGGSEGPARKLVEASLKNGKHVVTANKALIAHHGGELASHAEEAGRALAFEAAVAGGIPIIKAIRESLSGNTVSRVTGILNGTCNYIASTMRDTGRGFEDVLGEAQALGYAEANPAFDVDGVDAAHKLAILSSLAFGIPVDIDGVYVEGIRGVSAGDTAYAETLGYAIKLLGLAEHTEDGGVFLRVHPCMLPKDRPLAKIDGVDNAVEVLAEPIGRLLLEGPGAGEGATASAVLADILDIARGETRHGFTLPVAEWSKLPLKPMAERIGAYYIAVEVTDQPGVLADITRIFKDYGISVKSMLQRSRKPDAAVEVVLTTHATKEEGMIASLRAIAALDTVVTPPRMIRIEK